MPFVIGVMGEIGAGKEEFFKLLQEIAPPRKIVRYSTSLILRETLEKWGIPVTRDNLQALAISMDETFGVGTLTRAMKKDIVTEKASIVIYDSIRWLSDFLFIRENFEHAIVYITADQKLRWERSVKRKEKEGEEKVTFKEFQEREKAVTESTISKLIPHARYRISNNGSLEDYRKKVQFIYDDLCNTESL